MSGHSTATTTVRVLLALVVYAGFIGGFLWVIPHLLASELTHLFKTSRIGYAFAAVALIIAQGFLLESLTGALVRTFGRKSH
jgi:hypothetical protein